MATRTIGILKENHKKRKAANEGRDQATFTETKQNQSASTIAATAGPALASKNGQGNCIEKVGSLDNSEASKRQKLGKIKLYIILLKVLCNVYSLLE